MLLKSLIAYLAHLSTPRLVLWCYLIWYLSVLSGHFDSDPRLWLTSLGLGLVVGVALNLNARASQNGQSSVTTWQTLRFFIIPFCVSSFSSLVKGQGFFLFFSPQPAELVQATSACALFCLAVCLARKCAV